MGLYYLQTNIICIVILVIIYLTIRNRNNTLPARSVAFNRLLLIIVLICISDIFAWHFGGMIFPGARALIQISNLVYYGAITWAGYAWLCYVELRIKGLNYEDKKRKVIYAIPLLVMVVLLLTNPLTKLLFYIDENNVYTRGSAVFIHWIISWFYLFYATAEVVVRIRKSSSRVEKEQFIPMFLFIIPPVVASVFQMLFYGLTSTQCGMTLAALIIALNFMIDEVSKDSLTGLNNRRALEASVTERLQKTSLNYTVLMCDVDKFKTINDTLGHTAGDVVLKRMAEALKRTCADETRSLVLCRYGGDEFVICGIDMTEDEISEFKAKIEKNIASINDEYKDLQFGISIGQATGMCVTFDDVKALLGKADESMYEVKQKKKAAR